MFLVASHRDTRRSSTVAIARDRAAQSVDAPGTTLSPAVPGMVSVADHAGRIRGYLTEAEDSQEPAEVPLGTGAVPVEWFAVHDLDGTVTGYMLAGYGFVDRVSAQDPKMVDALLLNPLQVIDADGRLVSAAEWHVRTIAGTARAR